MYTITIKFSNNEERVYKTKKNPYNDKVLSLPWVMFQKHDLLLDKKDWAKSMETIFDKYVGQNIKYVKHFDVCADGRKKDVKRVKWLSWDDVFTMIEKSKGIVKVGDKVRIIKMDDSNGEDNQAKEYVGKEGVVEYIDDLGQLHGTWGGLSLIPNVDRYLKIS